MPTPEFNRTVIVDAGAGAHASALGRTSTGISVAASDDRRRPASRRNR